MNKKTLYDERSIIKGSYFIGFYKIGDKLQKKLKILIIKYQGQVLLTGVFSSCNHRSNRTETIWRDIRVPNPLTLLYIWWNRKRGSHHRTSFTLHVHNIFCLHKFLMNYHTCTGRWALWSRALTIIALQIVLISDSEEECWVKE